MLLLTLVFCNTRNTGRPNTGSTGNTHQSASVLAMDSSSRVNSAAICRASSETIASALVLMLFFCNTSNTSINSPIAPGHSFHITLRTVERWRIQGGGETDTQLWYYRLRRQNAPKRNKSLAKCKTKHFHNPFHQRICSENPGKKRQANDTEIKTETRKRGVRKGRTVESKGINFTLPWWNLKKNCVRKRLQCL